MEPNQTDSEHVRGALTRLTSWSLLLSHWTSFARQAVGLGETREDEAWRASIAPCIGLQAHVFALGELELLEPDERALGLDRAELGIHTHARALRAAWHDDAMPEGVAELIEDARRALEAAQRAEL